MKVMTYLENGRYRLAIVREDGIVPVPHGADGYPADAGAFYADGLDYLPALQALADQPATATVADVVPAPVVPAPGKIICVGLNYRNHASEAQMALPSEPILFSKYNNALAADGDTIPIPAGAEQIDYEAEMTAIIGARARNVSVAEALDYVLGYCNGNDVSARDWQFRTSQWLLGKTPDRFLPIGPYLVTADEVGDPQQLSIKLWLNGELRQNASTSQMIFSVAEIISYASRHMTLEPGDVIVTGTPEGVILGMEEKVWLKPGDEMTVAVEKLGELRNTLGASQ